MKHLAWQELLQHMLWLVSGSALIWLSPVSRLAVSFASILATVGDGHSQEGSGISAEWGSLGWSTVFSWAGAFATPSAEPPALPHDPEHFSWLCLQHCQCVRCLEAG